MRDYYVFWNKAPVAVAAGSATFGVPRPLAGQNEDNQMQTVAWGEGSSRSRSSSCCGGSLTASASTQVGVWHQDPNGAVHRRKGGTRGRCRCSRPQTDDTRAETEPSRGRDGRECCCCCGELAAENTRRVYAYGGVLKTARALGAAVSSVRYPATTRDKYPRDELPRSRLKRGEFVEACRLSKVDWSSRCRRMRDSASKSKLWHFSWAKSVTCCILEHAIVLELPAGAVREQGY